MGASLTSIDRHSGHLARNGREHAIRPLDELSAGQRPRWTLVDAGWTPTSVTAARRGNERTKEAAKQAKSRSPLTDSNRRPPLYEGGPGVKWWFPAIAQSGRSRRVRSASSAHLSIASSREDQAGWEARSGSASP